MSHPTQRSQRQQMARAVALLFLLTPKVALAAAKPLMQRSADAYRTKTIQAEASAKAEENADLDAAPLTESRTVLFDLNGNAVGEFAGTFLDVTPDGQRAIAYSDLESCSYLYDIDGTEIATLKGFFQGLTPDGQRLIAYSQGKSYLYDLSGNEQTVLNGSIQWSSLDGHHLITTAENPQQFSLYSDEGIVQSTFEGIFKGFAPNTQQLVTVDSATSHVYNFDGTLETILEGVFQAFSPEGTGAVTVVYDEAQRTERSLLYDLSGNLQATFTGDFASFLPDGNAIVIDSGGLFQSWLYRLDGSLLATFKGDFISFSPDGETLFTYSEEGSHLYTLDGQQQGIFEGAIAGVTADSQRLVTETVSTGQTQLYDTNGNKLSSLQGLFVGFISDEQRIVTSDKGTFGLANLTPATYRLYDLSGELQTVLEGQLLGLTATGSQGLVIYANGKSRLYNSLDGTEQAAFEGRVLGMTPDEQGAFISF